MVRFLLLFLLLFILLNVPSILIGAQLSVEIDKTKIEMGKYLNAQIIYEGESNPGQAELNLWNDNFHILRGFSETENLLTGNSQTIEKLRIYPRRAGVHTLHSLALGGAMTQPLQIQVTPSVRNDINGTPKWSRIAEQIWQGQSIKTCVNLKLFKSGNSVKIDEVDFPGFVTKAYPLKKYSANGENLVEQCWKISALSDGIHNLSLPSIEQRGRGRWKYFLPHQILEVLPLPGYLPPSVPVGKPLLTTKITVENQNIYWHTSVIIDGVYDSEVYGLRTTLANIANVPVEEVLFQQQNIDNGMRQQQLFKTPLPAWLWGYGKGPEISLRYFYTGTGDTQTGQLRTEKANLPPQWQLPKWFLIILLLTASLSLLLLVLKLYRLLDKLRKRHRFNKQILLATDAHQLRHLLLSQSLIAKTQEHKSLQQWAENISDKGAIEIADGLNELCFSSAPPYQLKKIKESLLSL